MIEAWLYRMKDWSRYLFASKDQALTDVELTKSHTASLIDYNWILLINLNKICSRPQISYYSSIRSRQYKKVFFNNFSVVRYVTIYNQTFHRFILLVSCSDFLRFFAKLPHYFYSNDINKTTTMIGTRTEEVNCFLCIVLLFVIEKP